MTDPLAFVAIPSRSLMARIRRWFDRRARRAALAELDDDGLRDIGLSPQDVRRIGIGRRWQITE
jgi:uncharacterized protein YjiS (DUF1127 family)